MGKLGSEQLSWLKADLASLSASTPIVVFAHIPLWMVYPNWGWGTQDGAEALSYLKRFGSVTVLNGHIHQVVQKVEGNVAFHTATSTAFPQPAPGFGRTSGTVAGFAYSPALVQARIVWNESTLEQWLTDLDTLVPGNNMDFHVAKPQERLELILYLKQASGK
jgi:3',5'-cyclic AMP phosphodiesterase CpdA